MSMIGMVLRGAIVASSILSAASCGGLDGPQPPTNPTSTTSTTEGEPNGTTVHPFVADNRDLRVAAAPDAKATVGVRSHRFTDMGDLYSFAMEKMGGEPIRNAAGEIVGVRGVSVASGDVSYRDEETGESFRAPDLAQAFLGGAAGKIEVAGEMLTIRERALSADGDIKITAALTGDSQGCVGDDCISGHSWRTNYVVYRSVGSETKQSSGGYGSVAYACCSAGTLVTYQGRLQCRVITEFEPADPENGIYKPIPTAYGYRPTQTCWYQTTMNSLFLGVSVVVPSGAVGNASMRTEPNTRVLTMSAWAVGVGVSFLGIDDVAGVCGFHSGSRGGATRTGAGNATDARCGTSAVFQVAAGSSPTTVVSLSQ